MDKKLVSRNEAWAVTLLVVLVAVIFAPLLYKTIIKRPMSDYRKHLRFADQVTSGERSLDSSPHFLYQALVILARNLVPGRDFLGGAFFISLSCFLLVGIVIYLWIRPPPESIPAFRQRIPYILFTLAALVMTPIVLFSWDGTRRSLLPGYLHNANVLHNPTNILLKPLALLLFLYALKVFIEETTTTTKIREKIKIAPILAAAGLTVLSTLTKPSFIICLVPALALVVPVRLWRKQSVNWRLLLGGVVIPAAVILCWQYFLRYSGDVSSTAVQYRIVFAPFAVASLRSHYLLPKFILSILFPLAVYIFYLKDTCKRLYLNLAWLGFGFGAFYAYFLAELNIDGEISPHGNLFWCTQITSFILFVASIRYLVRQKPKWTVPFAVCTVFFFFHLVSGVMFLSTYL